MDPNHRTQAKRFCRLVGLTAVSVYGGSGVGEQIRELKRGAEVVACTPGRFIDVLVSGYEYGMSFVLVFVDVLVYQYLVGVF